MDAQALLKERKDLFTDVIAFKKTKRVPTMGCFFSYKYLDAGYRLDEALYDYDIMEKCERRFIETYNFDAYSDSGSRNGMKAPDALGGGMHFITKDGMKIEAYDSGKMVSADEYAEYMADPVAFTWTKTFKRITKPDLTLGDLKTAALEMMGFVQFGNKMIDMFHNEYGALLGMNMTDISTILMPPLEGLFNGVRGMKDLALDIRKNKEELIAYLDFMAETTIYPQLNADVAPDSSGFIADYASAFLAHSILSVSQFEELYWPCLKTIIDFCVATNRTIYCFCEATMERFAEFFQDVPKGVLLIHLEQDNIFEMRKKLPNVAFVGGMPVDLLGHGTKEQCVDYAKKLIDEMGEGFVLSQNKMMSYLSDAKPENLIAVNEFARDYQC